MLIIDVGAHDGSQFSLPLAQDPNNEIYAIEPIPDLAEKIRSHRLPNVHVFCLAIGEEEGTFEFHINKNSQTSSLLSARCRDEWRAYTDDLEEVEAIEVPVMRLDSFIQKNNLTEIDLLKIDTQGNDLRVVKSLGSYIHCIKRIHLEVQLIPLYEGGSTKEEVVDYLADQGFRLLQATQQTDGLEENLEFLRMNRYCLDSQESDYFDVWVPYVGAFRTPQQDHVGQLLKEGTFEGPEQAFLWLYLRSGDTFLDCGSHTGLFSCIAAKKLENHGKIIGFEPNPICHQLYVENLNRLDCNCFTAFKVGLSDTAGCAELLLGNPGMSAFSTFAKGAIAHDELSQDKVLVDLCSLDDVLRDSEIDRVDLAKLDVEGWEAFVLQGAKQSISAGKFPLWMIEFTEANAIAAGSSTQALRHLIESLGYTLCCFDATHFRLIPEPNRLRYAYTNLYAVRDLKQVNDRLATADPTDVEIAKEIVSRWDTAMLTAGMYHHLAHENLQVKQLQDQLRQTQAALEHFQQQTAIVQSRVRAMESSKFWQLRTIWFQFKRMLRLPVNE